MTDDRYEQTNHLGVAIFGLGRAVWAPQPLAPPSVFDPPEEEEAPGLSPLQIVEAVLTGIFCAGMGFMVILGVIAWFLWGMK